MPGELWKDVILWLRELAALYRNKAGENEVFYSSKLGLAKEVHRHIAEEYRKDQSSLLQLAKTIQAKLKEVNEINQKHVELTLDHKMSDKVWNNWLTLLRRFANEWAKTEEYRKHATILRRFIRIVTFELNQQILSPAT
jgi:hypothetical protein